MSKFLFEGIYPPVPTYFTEDGKFDEAAQARALDYVIDAGVDGVLLLGSAGEFFSLTAERRKAILEFCVKHVAGRVKVLAGTGACGLEETLDLTAHAARTGADAVAVINPFYSPLSDECIYQHYRTVAEKSALPVLLYNYPAMTNQEISPDVIVRLARDCPNIVGIKDSVSDIAHTRRVILEVKRFRDDFCVFSGFDDQIVNNYALGGAGAIPGTAVFAPKLAVDLMKALREDDHEKVYALHCRISTLASVYYIETPYFGTLKTATRMMGVDVGESVAPPSLPLSPSGHVRLAALLMEQGLL